MRFARHAIVVVILVLTPACTGCADLVQSIMYGIFPVGSSKERGISDYTREVWAAQEQAEADKAEKTQFGSGN